MGIFFLFIVVIVIVAAFSIHQTNQLKDTWGDVASELRLNYDRSAPKIYGSRHGFSLRIKTVHRNKTKWTEFTLRYDKPLPLNFELTKQHNLTGITKLFSNGQDIEVGDDDFDERTIIKGKDPEKVREFLSPQMRSTLKEIFIAFDQFEIDSLGLTCHMHNAVRNGAMVIQYTELMCGAAKAMSKVFDEAVRVPPPIPDRSGSKEAILVVEEVAEPATPVPEEAPPEPSPFEFANPDTDEPVPIPPEVPPLELEPVPVSEYETRKDDAFAATAIELFETNPGNYAALRQFDTVLKNETISGRLTIHSVSAFQHDRVFGRGPGVVVNGKLGKLESGQSVSLNIAYTGETSLAEMKSQTGSELTYSGKLVKCDPFSHQFFLIAEEDKT